ncbi:MAG: hypothetical protein SGI89_11600 [bacterium]|nr:hypothetical protein [bacterium]
MISSTTIHQSRVNSLLFDYTELERKICEANKNITQEMSLHCRYSFDEIYNNKAFENYYFEMFFEVDEKENSTQFVRNYDFHKVAEIPEGVLFRVGCYKKHTKGLDKHITNGMEISETTLN